MSKQGLGQEAGMSVISVLRLCYVCRFGGISWGLLENMVRRMCGSFGGRRCARRGRVGGFSEWIWVLWEWICVLCDGMCVFWAGRR